LDKMKKGDSLRRFENILFEILRWLMLIIAILLTIWLIKKGI